MSKDVYVYEVVVYHGAESMNGLYPSMASARWHAKSVFEIDGTTKVWIRVWTLDKENGLYKVEYNEKVFDKEEKGDVR